MTILVSKLLKSKISRVLFSIMMFPLSTIMADEVHPIMKFFGMGKAPQSTILPANGITTEINDLYGLISWIGVIIFLIVTGLLFFIVYKFRESKKSKAIDSHGNVLLELLWTVIPVILIIIITVPTIRLIFKLENHPDLDKNKTVEYTTIDGNIAESNRYLEITAIAHQWWWEFEYVGYHVRDTDDQAAKLIPLNKKVGSNEIWLPLNVPIKVNITSEDVLHSFWVPRLMGKLDAVPGRINVINFVVEKEGYYYGLCAEYCGASHALMRFNIVGVTEDKFDAWVNWGKGDIVTNSASAERGKLAFQTCVGCHTMDGMKPFEPRQERFDESMAEYVEMKAIFLEEEKIWRDDYLKDKSGHVFFRDILEHPDRPIPPVKPVLYREDKTIAPDLTDFRFKKRILASIYNNHRDTVKEWIKNPPSLKPEIENTPVIRMPAYEKILNDQTIDDIIDFLMTVEYSESSFPPDIDGLFRAATPTDAL